MKIWGHLGRYLHCTISMIKVSLLIPIPLFYYGYNNNRSTSMADIIDVQTFHIDSYTVFLFLVL